MIFDRFSPASRRRRRLAEGIYARVVARSRDPWFYESCDVPDTVDGRFDMIVIHAHLLFRRLAALAEEGELLSQAVFDVMFKDMDRSLREMGVGDLSVGKHVKGMAKAFYGRTQLYEEGFIAGDEALKKALRDNIYRNVEPSEDAVERLADYMKQTAADLADAPLTALTAETGPFPSRDRASA
jgi:cytochrome b pre-mRNA-processing protein 3